MATANRGPEPVCRTTASRELHPALEGRLAGLHAEGTQATGTKVALSSMKLLTRAWREKPRTPALRR